MTILTRAWTTGGERHPRGAGAGHAHANTTSLHLGAGALPATSGAQESLSDAGASSVQRGRELVVPSPTPWAPALSHRDGRTKARGRGETGLQSQRGRPWSLLSLPALLGKVTLTRRKGTERQDRPRQL